MDMKQAESLERSKPWVLAKGSGPGLVALAVSLCCGFGYGALRAPNSDSFEGELHGQWLEGSLGQKDKGGYAFASGDLEGQSVSDPQFGLRFKGALVERHVAVYQWRETCLAEGCKVSSGWGEGVADSSKFKTPGYDNPTPWTQSLAFATRAKAGGVPISALASRSLGALSKPYLIGANEPDIAGLSKVDGGYQSFMGPPAIGSVRITYSMVSFGTAATMAGAFGSDGDLTAGPGGSFLAKAGSMEPYDLLGLKFWQMPKFGYALLAACVVFLIAGIAGLSISLKIERQILAERLRNQPRTRSASHARGNQDRGNAA